MTRLDCVVAPVIYRRKQRLRRGLYWGARQVSCMPNPVRGGFLMLQPTESRARPKTIDPAHTHFVRGGFLMLQPTGPRRTADDSRSSAYPPRQRWVSDATAYRKPCTAEDARSSAYPPRQRWVSDATATGPRRTADDARSSAYPPRQRWFLMLQPTRMRRTADDARSSAYPPRQRWVSDATAYKDATHGR